MSLEWVVGRFGLGALTAEPVAVAGGLSNDMWQVTTALGRFAVKRMVVNAGLPQFVENVEGAFRVEQRAWAAGVPMPEPIAEPGSGRALVRIDGELFRMHRWVDGRAPDGSAAGAAELLASIHSAGDPRWETAPDLRWDGERWGSELAGLGKRVQLGPDRMLIVDSHRDLDRKNVLLRSDRERGDRERGDRERGDRELGDRELGDGELIALDWDAAGPIGAVQEAVAVALDWAAPGADVHAFVAAVATYSRRTGVVVAAEPWVFGGWVAALGGWLDYNADHRAGEELGQAEIAATRQRMRALADDLDEWVEALTRA